jgi:hypothetical protein
MLFLFSIIAMISQPSSLLSYPNGVTGRTLKTTLSGCGSCHGSSATSGLIVSITGPDTVIIGQTYSFTVTVTGSSGSNGGIDIASSRGTLAAVSSNLKLSNSELTHSAKTSLPATYQFNYTAPAAAGNDTLWATGKGGSFTEWNWAPNKFLRVTLATEVAEQKYLPYKFVLDQNYPNPFNPATSIRYSIPLTATVTLKIYDTNGKEISSLVNETQESGDHSVEWNGEGMPSGVYMYRITAGYYMETRKMILLK